MGQKENRITKMKEELLVYNYDTPSMQLFNK